MSVQHIVLKNTINIIRIVDIIIIYFEIPNVIHVFVTQPQAELHYIAVTPGPGMLRILAFSIACWSRSLPDLGNSTTEYVGSIVGWKSINGTTLSSALAGTAILSNNSFIRPPGSSLRWCRARVVESTLSVFCYSAS